jgi:MerR family transcriptional regulator, thiopeptide resistance regulator
MKWNGLQGPAHLRKILLDPDIASGFTLLLDEGCAVPKLFHVQEFAELAGVTARALHHYDRLGLLKPNRTAAGYRIYGLRDLERLEQIVALKFLGIPLKQIRRMFQRGTNGMSDSLRMQRRVLEEKRRLLDSAIRAIEEAEKATAPGNRPDSAILKKIIEVLEMQDNMDWSKKYYNEGAQAKIEERKKLWSPENQERWTKEWTDLFRDVEAALNEDPAGAKAQALAARWKKLVEGFTGGDPQITAGLAKMYQDRPNWPATMQQRMQPFSNKKVWEFIHKAFAAGKTTN